MWAWFALGSDRVDDLLDLALSGMAFPDEVAARG